MKKRTLSLLILFAILVTCFAAMPFQAGATSSIRILYKCANGNPTSNTIAPWFKVINDGPDSINLSQVKIRYWYTRDTGRPQVYTCDYAQVGATNVTGNCVAMSSPGSTADYYLEVGFTAGAGSLASGSNSGEIQSRIHNDDWSSYAQGYDYSFNSGIIDYAQIPYITAYLNGVLVFGNEPPNASQSNNQKFLVVVSKPLYNTGLITQGLNNYLADLSNSGWAPTMITVDSVSSSSPQYVCATPAALKTVIQSYYNQGYVGLVLIGSDPSIPTAFWKHNPTEPVDPTDLYYADMGTWTDIDSDGVYESFDANPDTNPSANYYGAGFAPEMIWGRISAGCIATSLTDEANKVATYLTRIHNYKTSGSTLTQTQKERMLVFDDGNDFKGCRGDIESFMSLSTKIHGFFDDSITTPEKLKAEMENGYQFACYNIHSGADAHGISTWSSDQVYNLAYINAMSPRVHYLDMYCCSACRFRDPATGNVPNIGTTYIFNPNSLMLNVTGSTGGWGFVPRSSFWADIRAGKPIGEALRNYFTIMINTNGETGCPKGVLFGDPTITYSVPAITNKMPYITTNLAGESGKKRLELLINQAFTLNAFDSESNPVTITVSGLPSGAVTVSQPNQFTWTPAASDAGKIYYLTATASDNSSNQYVEEFSVKVVDGINNNPPTNLGFEDVYNGNPTGWDKVIFTVGSTLTTDSTVKYSGTYSAKISAPTPDNDVRFVQLVDLKPNTNYRFAGYIRTQDVQLGNGASLALEFDGQFPTTTTGLFGTNTTWQYVFIDFNSGASTSVQLQCRLGMYGGTSTGTAWYDGLTLTER